MTPFRPQYAFTALAALAALAGSLVLMAVRAAPDQVPDLVYAAGPEGASVLDVSDVNAPTRVGLEPAGAPALDIAVHWSSPAVAYAAAGERWAILDIRDPAAPKVSEGRPTAPRMARMVHTADQRLFVVTDDLRAGTSTILIHDAAEPLAPVQIGQVDLSAQVLGLDASAGHLFVATGGILVIYDIRVPTTPRLVGRLPRKAIGVVVDGPTAYVLEANGLAVADVADPGSPKEIGFAQLPTSMARDVDILRDTDCQAGCGQAVVGVDLERSGAGGGLFVVDARTPAQPQILGPVAEGSPVLDVDSDGPWIHTAGGTAGYVLFRHDAGSLPERAGGAQIPIDAVAPRTRWKAQSTETPTAETPTAETPTGETPSATPTSGRTTPTATPGSPTVTPTDTQTPRVRTPTPTPTSDRPGKTPVWELHDGESDGVPLDSVRYVAEAGSGRVWVRMRRPDGGPDRALESRSGRVVLHQTLEAAVESRYQQIVLDGSVENMWSVDALRRVWIGPQYYDGRAWWRLAFDDHQPGGNLIHEERALLDVDGRAWVPYQAVVSCPAPEGCRNAGIRVFGTDALERALPLELVPEAAEYAIEPANLIQGRPGAIVASSAGPHQAGDEDWVVGQRALILTPGGEAVEYPELGAADQNAGYASSSARTPDGKLQVFTWVEDHTRPGLAWRTLANTWQGPNWDVWDLTVECPLVHDANEEYLRVTAAEYAPDGTLWLGSSYGEVATWREGSWLSHFTSDNSPLLDERPVTDITVTSTGAAWVVQPGALLTYGGPGELTVAFSGFAPRVLQR